MNLTDAIAPAQRATFMLFARSQTYEGVTGVFMFSRGVRADDLFAAAQQLDMMGQVDAAQFAAKFPSRPLPKRMDKVTIGTKTYTVQEWRGAPNDDAPVFFKMLLRGGSQ